MPDPLPTPFPITLVMCDGVHVDPYTGRRTLLGEFDEFFSPQFPASIPVVYVFAEVTECRGTLPVRIRFAPADPEREPIWETDPVELVADSPLVRLAMHWGLLDLSFPDPGVYMVQLIDSYDRVISQRCLFITDQASGSRG